MEQALILVVLAPTFKSETLEKIRKIPGVSMAHLLYGPYDMFATIKVESLNELRAAVTKIRETEGIRSTITCNVIKPAQTLALSAFRANDLGMTETVFHEWREAGFEAFPAENYVDYMTNVMPVPERHVFYLPSRGKAIVCEIRGHGDLRVLGWSLRGYDKLPTAKSAVRIEKGRIEEMLSILDERDKPIVCGVCEKILGAHLKRVR